MSASKTRFSAALLGLVALTLGTAAFAASAQAAPYSTQPTVAVSDQTPTTGGTFTLTGSGFAADEDVANTLHTVTYPLTGAHTSAAGDFSVLVTLPAGVTGTHTIVSTGTTGDTASVTITIGAPASGSGNSGGGLATTGVAVIGIGSLGVVLLVGGGLMLLVGKRRRVRVSA